jgi:hypothetical protein
VWYSAPVRIGFLSEVGNGGNHRLNGVLPIVELIDETSHAGSLHRDTIFGKEDRCTRAQ